MKAVIMAGGEGTRLRPLTEKTPKPLIPVCGRPCMSYVLDMLADAGISEAMITLRYLAHEIVREFGPEYRGMKLRYSVEKEPLGTAGSVRACSDFLAGESCFVVTSGDSVCSLDLTGALEFHNQNSADATLLLAEVPDVLEYGVVVTQDDGEIVKFIEKPAWGQAFSDTVNTGTYIFDISVLEKIPDGENRDFGRDVLPALEAQRARIYGYRAPGFWYDVGDPASLLDCILTLNRGSFVSETSSIDLGVLVIDSVIMDGARVGRGAALERCIVAPGETVPAGKELSGAVWYGGKEYPMRNVRSARELGLGFASACPKGRVGAGGPGRTDIIKGIAEGGGNARDLGPASARLCAFAAREYGLDCSVWAGDRILVFDEHGLAASKKFLRSLSGGKPAQAPGTVTELHGLEARYVHELASMTERVDGLRFRTDDALVRRALEMQGAVFDRRSMLSISNGLAGLDIWHLCAIIIANGNYRAVAFPYSAPAALTDFARSKHIDVRRYAIIPFDDSEAQTRALVRENQWLCDDNFAAVKVLGIMWSAGRSLDDLLREVPDFCTTERRVKGDGRARLTVMKKFGTPDGEGVIRIFSEGRVRAIPDEYGIRVIAEASSFEAADELAAVSASEIRRLTE